MDGIVENADNLQIGQMAVTGLGMLSIVHSATAWVEANFKEKDVGRMVPGQRAEITVDAYSGQKFAAHVQSVGAGTGSEFSLLPAQNANGNWVKVTQRVPVRVAFNGNSIEADDRRAFRHRDCLFRRQQEEIGSRRWPKLQAILQLTRCRRAIG